MPRYKAIVEYDGTDFSGWQIQPESITLQECIENGLSDLLGHHLRVSASGRTDAGVHALGQVISFVTDKNITCRNVMKGTNVRLPESVRLVSVEKAPDAFDPRRDAILRWYRYSVINRSVEPVIARRFVTHIPYRLDFSILEKALSMFPGEHDFSGFRSVQCSASRTNLTMETVSMKRIGDFFYVDFKCRSFLHNMIRIIMGGVIEVARGKKSIHILDEMLSSGERNSSVPTAPARGLCLMKVYYHDYDRDDPEIPV